MLPLRKEKSGALVVNSPGMALVYRIKNHIQKLQASKCL